jgi:hypothetical protein
VLVLIIGASLVVNVVWRFVERRVGLDQVPRKHADWVEEVRRVLFSLVDAEIDKANLEARLAHLVGKQPPEYDALAKEAFKRQLLLHPAMAAKAEEMGLFPDGTFARLGVPRYADFNPTDVDPAAVRRAALERVVAAQTPPTTIVGTVQLPKGSNGAPN